MQKHSTVEVLGCSGSIGIPGQGTTSFLIDSDILIDALGRAPVLQAIDQPDLVGLCLDGTGWFAYRV